MTTFVKFPDEIFIVVEQDADTSNKTFRHTSSYDDAVERILKYHPKIVTKDDIKLDTWIRPDYNSFMIRKFTIDQPDEAKYNDARLCYVDFPKTLYIVGHYFNDTKLVLTSGDDDEEDEDWFESSA